MSIFVRNKVSFDYKTKAGHWIYLFGLFVCIVLTEIPFMGFHLNCDTSFHLVGQGIAVREGIEYIGINPFWWLTDFVGGWWLKLVDAYGMWGARLGGAVCLGLTGAVSASALLQLYRDRIGVFIAILLIALWSPNDKIDYLTFPTLLYAVLSLSLLKMNMRPTEMRYAVISAIAFVLLVFSRMPMVVAILAPVFCLSLAWIFDRSRMKQLLIPYTVMFGVILCCIFAFALFLYSQNLLGKYLFYKIPSPTHTVSSLSSLWLSQIITKIPILLAWGAGFFTVFWIVDRKLLTRKTSNVLFLLFAAILFVFVLLYIKYPSIKTQLKFFWPDSFDVLPILTFFNICLAALNRRDLRFPEILLIVLGAMGPLLLTIGSNAGLYVICLNGFILCGQSFMLTSKALRTQEYKTTVFFLAVLVFSIVGGKGFKNLIVPYLNKEIHHEIHTEKLASTYTTLQNAKNIEEIVAEIHRYAQKGDSILAEPYIFLLYYATETWPLTNHPSLFVLDIERFKDKLDELIKQPAPKLIVRPKIGLNGERMDDWDYFWQNTTGDKELMEKLKIYDQKITQVWKPSRVWSNEYFEIWIPENKSFNERNDIQ